MLGRSTAPQVQDIVHRVTRVDHVCDQWVFAQGYLHTTRENLGLLDGSLVQDGASLHQLDGLRAGVGDNRFHSRVANTLDLNLERAVTLGNVHPHRKGGGNEGKAGEELHGDWLILTRTKLRRCLCLDETGPFAW